MFVGFVCVQFCCCFVFCFLWLGEGQGGLKQKCIENPPNKQITSRELHIYQVVGSETLQTLRLEDCLKYFVSKRHIKAVAGVGKLCANHSAPNPVYIKMSHICLSHFFFLFVCVCAWFFSFGLGFTLTWPVQKCRWL